MRSAFTNEYVTEGPEKAHEVLARKDSNTQERWAKSEGGK